MRFKFWQAWGVGTFLWAGGGFMQYMQPSHADPAWAGFVVVGGLGLTVAAASTFRRYFRLTKRSADADERDAGGPVSGEIQRAGPRCIHSYPTEVVSYCVECGGIRDPRHIATPDTHPTGER